MIRRTAARRHLRLLKTMPTPPRPVAPEPPSTPRLTTYAGEMTRAIQVGNELILRGQVLRGDQ